MIVIPGFPGRETSIVDFTPRDWCNLFVAFAATKLRVGGPLHV